MSTDAASSEEAKAEYPGAQPKLTDLEVKIADVADEQTERQAILGLNKELSPEEQAKEAAFLRRIDWHILPLLMITYGFQYADKISLSSGVAFDLTKNAGLVGNDFAWLSTGFYLAYMIFEFPVNFAMQKYPLDKILAYTVLGWGVCVLCMAACHNFTQLMAVRTLLGILEAPVTPGFLIIVSAWYKNTEQIPRNMAFFGFSLWVLMCNYAVGVAAKGSSIASWKAINLFLGSLSFIWGIILCIFLCTPKNARWLTPEEKVYAHARLVTNKTGESTSGFAVQWYQVREAFIDPQTWFLCVFTLLGMAASGGFSTFSTIILQSFGLTTKETIMYQLPWYAIMFSWTVVVGVIAHKFPRKNWNLIIVLGSMVLPIVGIFLEGLLPNTKHWGRLVGFWLTGLYLAPYYLIWAQISVNTAGRTKKTTVQAFNFFCWCLGFVVGPQAFQAKDKPQYRPGLYFCCACFIAVEIVVAFWLIWVRWENKRRDKRSLAMGYTEEQAELEGMLLGLQDKTDRENPHFRYRY